MALRDELADVLERNPRGGALTEVPGLWAPRPSRWRRRWRIEALGDRIDGADRGDIRPRPWGSCVMPWGWSQLWR
eukprot:6970281-Alexandrium_andersonii.AAC.2